MPTDAELLQQLMQSQPWQNASPAEREQLKREWDALSLQDRERIAVDMPSVRERATAALPYARQQARTALESAQDIATGQAGQMVRATPAVPQALTIARERNVLPARGQGGLVGMGADILQEGGRQPTPRELVAQGTSMALGGVTGGVLSRYGLQRLTPYLEPLVNLAARKINVATGAEEGTPGKIDLGDIASVAVPLGVRAIGGAAGAFARHGEAGKTLKDYDAAVQQAQDTAAVERITVQEQNRRMRQQYLDALKGREQRIQENVQASQLGPQTSEMVWGGARATAKQQVAAAYDIAGKAAGNTTIPFQSVRDAAQKVIDELAVPQTAQHPLLPRDNRVWKLAEKLRDLGKDPETNLAPDPKFTDLQKLMQGEDGLGDLYGSALGNDRRLLGKLYYAVFNAMESGGGGAHSALRIAAAKARKNFALQDWEALWTPGKPGSGVRLTGDGNLEVNPATILNKFEELKRQELFRGAFTAKELASFGDELKRLATLEKIGKRPGRLPAETPPPVPRQPVPEPELPDLNIRQVLTHNMGYGLTGAGVGGGLAAMGVGNFTTNLALGSAAGISLEAIGRVLSQALISKEGRPFLRRLMATKPFITPMELALLNTALRTTPPRETQEDRSP